MMSKIFSKSKPAQKRREASGASDAHGGSLDVESLAEGAVSQEQDSGSASATGRSYLETLNSDDWSSRFECMGELIVERNADLSDVVQVCQTLNDGLEAEILYVSPTDCGMSIVCGIKDPGPFIASLSKMPKLVSWALVHG